MIWVVVRDEEFFEAYRTKRRAVEIMRMYLPGSKHKWRVSKAYISWSEEEDASRIHDR